MSIEAMKRIKSLLQDCAKIDSHTISAVVAECDMAILAQHPATTEPVKVAPYNPTEEMRWAMKRIDPALSSEQCRALWSAAWSATPFYTTQRPTQATQATDYVGGEPDGIVIGFHEGNALVDHAGNLEEGNCLFLSPTIPTQAKKEQE